MQTRKSRFSRALAGLLIALPAAALICVVAIRCYPALAVLLAPGVKYRTPYCSKWDAARDVRIKLRQEDGAAAIAAASRVLRREAGLALWATPEGEYWIPESDGAVLPTLLAQARRDIYGSGAWGVQPGDTVLDCGAYVGTTARQALARGARLIVAIEPTPESVECLRRNLAGEIAAGKVIVYPKGVWDSETELTFSVNPANLAGNSFLGSPSGPKQLSIPVTTIDRVAAELRLRRVDFIKADIKGATERMLRGGRTVIARDRPRLALSTEEANDNAAGIAALTKSIQPAYEMKCGPCLLDGRDVYTDVLFFR
jgi:FkbM family methyltransferase